LESGKFGRYSDGILVGQPGFDSRKGTIFISFPYHPGWLWGPPILLSQLVKLPEREADFAPLSSVEMKNGGPILQLPYDLVLN
jgi:hypothetical protein